MDHTIYTSLFRPGLSLSLAVSPFLHRGIGFSIKNSKKSLLVCTGSGSGVALHPLTNTRQLQLFSRSVLVSFTRIRKSEVPAKLLLLMCATTSQILIIFSVNSLL